MISLLFIVPPLPSECVRQLLESLAQITRRNKGGDDEPVDANRN